MPHFRLPPAATNSGLNGAVAIYGEPISPLSPCWYKTGDAIHVFQSGSIRNNTDVAIVRRAELTASATSVTSANDRQAADQTKKYLEWPIDIDAATKMFKERDECEAMEEAAADLTRLERYHRRTWSRQKRTIRNFTNMKLMRALAETAEPAPNKRELTPK